FSTLVGLFEKPAAGGEDTPITGTGNHYAIFPEGMSKDGKWLVYVATGNTGWDIWGLSLADRKSRPIIEAPASQAQASLSPNGRWLAYASDESGSWEVYVQPFPEGAGKWQVSAGGGSQPRWRGDGKEIYYIDREGQLTVVTVDAASAFEIGARRPLFRTRVGAMLAPFRINYDLAPDGQRFLINSPLTDPDPTRITIVLNWQAGLDARSRVP
ncbi:MAG: TolB family protein, partial [Vicinamibacterales bacterium]